MVIRKSFTLHRTQAAYAQCVKLLAVCMYCSFKPCFDETIAILHCNVMRFRLVLRHSLLPLASSVTGPEPC
jgi:hypothetical protein